MAEVNRSLTIASLRPYDGAVSGQGHASEGNSVQQRRHHSGSTPIFLATNHPLTPLLDTTFPRRTWSTLPRYRFAKLTYTKFLLIVNKHRDLVSLAHISLRYISSLLLPSIEIKPFQSKASSLHQAASSSLRRHLALRPPHFTTSSYITSTMSNLPDGLIAYGPNANCTLALCPITATIYQYRPSLVASSVFIALFGLSMILHTWRGIRYREWFFMSAVLCGSIAEIIGYAGRIMLYQNPFSFNGFIIQICCITFAPVFYCAAIYVLLTRITNYLDASVSRVPPKFYIWFFLPCDIVSLALQASGGAMSSSSSGSDKLGVNISLAGLGLQVGTLSLFIIGCADYAWRYSRKTDRAPLTRGFKIFAGFVGISILLIFIRCAYRINELADGYSGPNITDQAAFIGLESCMIVISAFTLLGANPGPVMPRHGKKTEKEIEVEKGIQSDSSSGLVSPGAATAAQPK